MKRLIKAIYTKKEQDKIFDEYKNSKLFGKRQLNIIYKALFDLTKEQVDLFAKPEFDYKFMDRMRRYFNLMDVEDVKFLIDSNFSSEQMDVVVEAILENMPKEKLNLFANNKFSYHQMLIIKNVIDNNYSMEQLKLISNPDIDPYDMLKIKLEFDEGLSIEQIKDLENIAFKLKRLIKNN